MIGTLVGIIFALIIIGVIYWAVTSILGTLPLPDPIRTVINVLLILIMVIIVLWVLLQLLGMAGIHVPSFGAGSLR